MEISISSRHLDLPADVKAYAEEKFSRVDRINHGILSLEVILKEEDRKKHCEVIVVVRNKGSVVVDVARDELPEAIDVAVSKIERQMRRLKEKTTSHRGRREPEESLAGAEADNYDED